MNVFPLTFMITILLYFHCPLSFLPLNVHLDGFKLPFLTKIGSSSSTNIFPFSLGSSKLNLKFIPVIRLWLQVKNLMRLWLWRIKPRLWLLLFKYDASLLLLPVFSDCIKRTYTVFKFFDSVRTVHNFLNSARPCLLHEWRHMRKT
jgi:hypothetical protein